MKPVEECKTVTELFEDPTRWTQGAAARGIDGNSILPENPNAVCWCVTGAIRKIYPISNISEIDSKLSSALDRSMVWIPVWNDWNPYETIFNKVKELGI